MNSANFLEIFMRRVELEGEFTYIYVQIVEITIRVIWPLSRY